MHFKDGLPYSPQFDDIYFSAEAESETKHVFIEGNRLATLWAKPGNHVIGELGFGTGLNFHITAQQFLAGAHPRARLFYVSCEKFPLGSSEMHEFWEKKHVCPEFLAQWPGITNTGRSMRLSFHEGRITLDLLFDDALSAWKNFHGQVNAWYFDGFSPAKNPEMWSASLFRILRKKSAPDATFATYTSAGVVKRNLVAAGWQFHRIKGAGKKRHMLIGTPLPGRSTHAPVKYVLPNDLHIAIIGAGIAGSAVAYTLGKRGANVNVFEKEKAPAHKASGNALGLILPHFFREHDIRGQFQMMAYNHFRNFVSRHKALREKSIVAEIVGHVEHNFSREDLERNGFLPYIAPSEQDTGNEFLLKDCFLVSPAKLCEWLLTESGAKQYYSCNVTYIEPGQNRITFTNENSSISKEFDVVIWACGAETTAHAGQFNIIARDGAVIELRDTPLNQPFLFSGNYYACADNRVAVAGTTFEDVPLSNKQRKERILGALADKLPTDFLQNFYRQGSIRVSKRATLRDFMPVVGPGTVLDGGAADTGTHFYLAGLGSHGLKTALLCAESLSAEILSEPDALPENLKAAVAPYRFLSRDKNK